ncbi:uncharacterized protein [Clytia hemisphaerica]|uniref:Uncharacterized protein n=1 Tax=Clytia hemisphaerica TaxID=252671 RepID=A0A7M5XD21_9CNID
MAPQNMTGLVDDLDIWRNSGMIVPAIMTLICFVCTAVSLTVSGFICLRDREAQEASDNKAKHHKEQEFVSKVLGLFYKIRTSNIFRIQEIMQDLNDERPVWIGKKSEIILNLEYYGIYLTEREKTKLSASHEVFEIDCQSLFYFELERFSKAQAIYGPNVLKYFESIQQDGAAFPREFYPDSKPVFGTDIIYNVFTEMQIFTELFVLLSTGIDLEIISVRAIPSQFRHSKLGQELSMIQNFLYNYYLRVFPQERSTAAVMRKLPDLPIIYEPIAPTDEGGERETIETIIEESEEVIDPPASRRSSIMGRAPPIIPPPPAGTSSRRSSVASASGSTSKTSTTTTTKPRKMSLANLDKQRLKLINAYKTISERVRERPAYMGEEVDEEEEDVGDEDFSQESGELNASMDSRRVSFQSETTPKHSPKKDPQIRTKRKTIKKKIVEKRAVPETAAQQEVLLDEMRKRYKAPVRRDNSRRRGRLIKEETLIHNAFTYMTTRVIAFLQEKGQLSDEQIDNTKYLAVDRSFII